MYYFLRGFCGEGVKKNAAIFNTKLYSTVWNHKYSWKTCVRGFRGSP